jgi:hypothetical protein
LLELRGVPKKFKELLVEEILEVLSKLIKFSESEETFRQTVFKIAITVLRLSNRDQQHLLWVNSIFLFSSDRIYCTAI